MDNILLMKHFSLLDMCVYIQNSDQWQCIDYYFSVCPFTTRKICLKYARNFVNTKYLLKLPNYFNILPKWQNFAKSGHTEVHWSNH